MLGVSDPPTLVCVVNTKSITPRFNCIESMEANPKGGGAANKGLNELSELQRLLAAESIDAGYDESYGWQVRASGMRRFIRNEQTK